MLVQEPISYVVVLGRYGHYASIVCREAHRVIIMYTSVVQEIRQFEVALVCPR